MVFSSCTKASEKNSGNPDDVQNIEVYTFKTKNTTEYFATLSSLRVFDDFSNPNNINKFDELWLDLKDILNQIENDVSVALESSDIYKFNQLNYGESILISDNTAKILKIAKDAHNSSRGLYDPSVYPLVDLWAFAPRFNKPGYSPEFSYDRERISNIFPLPDKKYIEGFLKLADFNNIVLSGDEEKGYTLTKNIETVTIDGITYEAKLDLGGIAKGYAVDAAMELLKEYGYEYGYFSCGRSSIGILKNASKASVENDTFRYNLEIRKPRQGNTDSISFMSIAIKDARISSSGDYDHNYEIEGIIYSHIIDSKTGFPMNTIFENSQKGIATATVIGDNTTMCDAVSTAICLMDLKEALEYINSHKDTYKVMLVLYNSNYNYYEVITNLDADEYLIHDDAYELASVLDNEGNIIYEGQLIK
jgi:thiamine biosynthesis lipoprotein